MKADYKIISWSELDYIDAIVKKQKTKKWIFMQKDSSFK